MIVVNQHFTGAKIYVIALGEEYFGIYAETKDEAVERLVETLNADWYFSDDEIEILAQSVHKTFDEYILDADLYHCPKHKVCLPKIKIQEVIL